jgi:ADP-L-glycero-D-manno-heptose 6-epimerase
VYVKDCCAVIQKLLATPTFGGIFNVGTGVARSFADLATAVFAAIGLEPNIEYVEMPARLRGRYQYFTQADMSRLTSLGLAPAFHTLEAGIADYVQGYLAPEFGKCRHEDGAVPRLAPSG